MECSFSIIHLYHKIQQIVNICLVFIKYIDLINISTLIKYTNLTNILFLQSIQTQQMFQNKLLSSTGITSQDYQRTLQTHKTFLNKFKSLPDKTRKATYKQLLMLPNNYSHLQQLTKPYPVLPQHGHNKQVAIIADILGRLYPQLQNQWVPCMIHPFIKLFQQDFTFSFQCSLTFLMNWLKPVLFDFPNANKQVMEVFQICLPRLKQKIESLDYPLSSLINPMFVVTLTDVFNRKDWLQICDFWVTNPFQPWHYLSIAIAIVQIVEDRLQKFFSVQEMSIALRKQKNIQVQKIIQKAKQISTKYKQKFLVIYKDSVFPIQQGRYPVYKFFRAPIRKTNSKIQAQDDLQIEEIKHKYQKLQLMLQKFINEGHISDEQAIETKYQMVEGQVRQYLNLIKQEHANKMSALRQIESKFNAQLQSQGQNRQTKTSAIEKRARLQRQIQTLLAESESIKQMQDQMMKRVQQCLKVKKNELKKINQSLRNH